MRRSVLVLGIVMLFGVAAGPLVAQTPVPFSVSSFRHELDGFDRRFVFTVRNDSEFRERLTGRLIVLSVYDLGPSDSLLIPAVEIPARGSEKIELLWQNAPVIGQMRALLVLTDGRGRTVVDSYSAWLFPWQGLLIVAGSLLVLVGVMLLVVRRAGTRRPRSNDVKPKREGKTRPTPRKKKRAPSGMVWYRVEEEDTVVTVAERFGVTWEDIVSSNRLKPPYELKAGSEILVPKHELRHPETS